MDPKGTVLQKIGGLPQDMTQSGYFDWLFNTAENISRQLGGDPPRDDYKQIARPQPVHVELNLEGLPQARAEAVRKLQAALEELVANLRAALISQERLGGAVKAGDDEWIQKQALALVEYKSAAGDGYLQVARCLEELAQVLEDEGLGDAAVSAEDYRAYQQVLAQQGFAQWEVELAQRLGLDEERIAQLKAERLKLEPEQVAAGEGMAQRLRTAAEAMRALGERWASLPSYDLDALLGQGE